MASLRTLLIRTGAALLLTGMSSAQTNPLGYRPVDAEYSTALDRIIMVSANPNLLHIYDPVSRGETTVALEKAPTSVSIGPTGYYAAVGHDSLISYVNLSTRTVEKTLAVTATSIRHLTLGAGYVYLLPNRSINIASGVMTTLPGFYYDASGRLHPTQTRIYGASTYTSYLARYDVSAGTISLTIASSEQAACGLVWLSPDGNRIYTGCGTVLRSSADPAADMKYHGRLNGLTSLTGLAESTSLSRIAAIPAKSSSYYDPPQSDREIRLFDNTNFRASGRLLLPDFWANGRNYEAHGKWLFFNNAGSSLFVINHADSTSGLLNDFAVQTYPLASPTPCSVTLSATSASVIAAGSLGTVNITATADCIYQAVSNVAWINVVSGGYGSGNGTLTWIARPNLTTIPRSGTITVAGQTFTISQEGAPVSPPPLTRLSYRVVAADYSKVLDVLVLISSDPDELHIYDPGARSDNIVPLSRAPKAVSVRPDGLYAAVAHDGMISHVGLQTGAVQTFPVPFNVSEIVLAGNGYAYFVAGSSLYSLNIATGVATAGSGSAWGTGTRLHPSGKYIYRGGSTIKWDITGGVAKPATAPAGGSSDSCGDLWITESGNRIFTACANVYRSSESPQEDLQPNGTLASAPRVRWAAHSLTRSSTAVIPREYYSQWIYDTEVQLYGDESLALTSRYPIAPFSIGGSTYAAHGRFVFWNSAANKMFVVAAADEAARLLSDAAVHTISPDAPGASCTYTISPVPTSVPASGVSRQISVETAPGCLWEVKTAASFLYVSQNLYSGPGALTLNISPTYSVKPQAGTLTIAGQSFQITQAGVVGAVSLSPAAISIPAGGVSGNSVYVSANASDFAWSAVSNAAWITITSGASGNGSSHVYYSVAANTGLSVRTGTITISDKSFTVVQAGQGGFVTLNHTYSSWSYPGGASSVSVSASRSDYYWTATTDMSWIVITAGAGTGNGVVSYTVLSNPTVATRTGVIIIGNATFVVSQSGQTGTITLGASLLGFGPAAVASSVTVTATPATLSWSAVSNASWITITGGASGTGNGIVSFSLTQNTTGVLRSGTITVDTQAVTITQTALSLSPIGQQSGAGGGTASVNVTTGRADQTWTAVSNASWITVTAGASGSGSGQVTYSVAANTATSLRSGTLTIGDQTFAVTQSGSTPPSVALRFVPVTPCRIADTRNPSGPFGAPHLTADSTRTFFVPSSGCGIPATARAYALNVTVVPRGFLGYLSIWPAGQIKPWVSTLNSLDGRIKANAAIVPAGDAGGVSVYAQNATDVILDISGYFVPANDATALAFYPLTPCRVVDTRETARLLLGAPSMSANQRRTFPILASTCGIPPNAYAYSLNFTVVPKGMLGFLSTWPTGHQQPWVSTLNALTGTITANAAIVPAGAGGAIDVFAQHNTDLIIDVNGYFAAPGPGGMSLYNVTPCRVFDTRTPTGAPRLAANTARAVPVTGSTCGVPAEARAFAMNATVVPSGIMGFLALWPMGAAQPWVSTLNAVDGAITSNMAIVPSSNGSINALGYNATDLLLDVSAYFGP